MQPYQIVITILFAGLSIALAVKIFTAPLKIIAKLALNILLGFGLLFVVNLVGGLIGIHLGVNFVNAAVIALLGIPGLALLLLLRWLLVI